LGDGKAAAAHLIGKRRGLDQDWVVDRLCFVGQQKLEIKIVKSVRRVELPIESCCMICKSNNSVDPWFEKEARGSSYPIVRCSACQSAYVWPRPKLSDILAIYSSLVEVSGANESGIYWPNAEEDARRIFSNFGPHIKAAGAILDIGAGEGVASAEAVRRGFKVRACEPSPHACRAFAQRMGFEPDPTFFSEEYAEENRGLFDAALLSHVLEHILDIEKFVQDMRLVLKPGGSLIIAVPHFGSILTAVMGKKDFFITPPIHLNYFSLPGMTALLKRNGFSVEASFTSSKVNVERYKARLGPGRYAINTAGYLAMRVSEAFKRSIVLNVCAKLQ
jgi:SAM-dependent methyltransferase